MMRRPRVRDERGAGTLLVVSVCLVLAIAAFVGVWVTGWLASANRARNVADLTAQAAAQAYAHGKDACRAAERTASLNSGQLVACRVDGDHFEFAVTVLVQVELRPTIVGGPAHVEGAATAGSVP